MQSYPSEREQTKVNQAYSSLEEILFGLPQGSILDLILFNIFLSDLFLIVQNVDFKSYVTTMHYMMHVAVLMRSYFLCKNLLKNFLNGSPLIK